MKSKRRQSGFILIITVIITAVITTLVLACSRTINITNASVNQVIDYNRAEHINKSGISYALSLIAEEGDITNVKKLTVDFDGILCEIEIQCDNGKININNLVDSSDDYDSTYVDIFANLITQNNLSDNNDKINLNTIAAIVDAIDKNEDKSRIKINGGSYIGAENKYYKENSLPLCKNTQFDNLAELLFVKGFENTVILDNLTVQQVEKIDINCASAEIIAALSNDIDINKAKQLTVTGKKGIYNSVAEFLTKAEVGINDSTTLQGILTTEPAKRYYTVLARCMVNGHASMLKAKLTPTDNETYTVKIYR